MALRCISHQVMPGLREACGHLPNGITGGSRRGSLLSTGSRRQHETNVESTFHLLLWQTGTLTSLTADRKGAGKLGTFWAQSGLPITDGVSAWAPRPSAQGSHHSWEQRGDGGQNPPLGRDRGWSGNLRRPLSSSSFLSPHTVTPADDGPAV